MSPYFAWLKYLSFFQYALEALLVNELIYLQLIEERFGLSIDVSYFLFYRLMDSLISLFIAHSFST